jgi:PilZ domain
MEESRRQFNRSSLNRRSLERVAPASRMRAAVENTTRSQILGMAEVIDFSGLGLALRGMAGDPVAALGDHLYVTLITDEGLIPVQAVIVRIKGVELWGLRLQAPSAAGEHFLINLYLRAVEELQG